MPPRSLADAERGHHACADVIGHRHRAHEVASASPRELACGERRRHRAAAEMNGPDRIGIVGFVGVRRHRVRERRIDW